MSLEQKDDSAKSYYYVTTIYKKLSPYFREGFFSATARSYLQISSQHVRRSKNMFLPLMPSVTLEMFFLPVSSKY